MKALGRLCAVAAVVLAFCLVGPPAAAHTALAGSNPPDGATLGEAPAEIVLDFTQPVTPAADSIVVTGPDGGPVPVTVAGVGAAATTVAGPLPGGLASGSYAVQWAVLSEDSHPVTGSFSFTLDLPPPPSTTAATTTPPTTGSAGPPADAGRAETISPPSGQPWKLLEGVARWVTYIASLLAVGAVLFAGYAHDGRSDERPMLARTVRWAGLAAAAGTAAELAMHGLQLDSVGIWPGAGEYLGSSFGTAALVRLVGSVLVAAGAGLLATRRWSWPTVLGSVAVLVSFPLAGHTATATPRVVLQIADLVHVAAASVWFGGVVLLAVILRRREGAGDEVGPAAELLDRFGLLAVGSIVAVALAGAVVGWTEVGSWSNLLGTAYGATLLLKLALVGVVVGIGAYNHRALVPSLTDGEPGADWARLVRTVEAEALALVAVLVVTAFLAGIAAPGPQT